MSFDDEEQQQDKPGEKKPKTFFGLELGDGEVYTIVITPTLIFIRQVSVVIQALN